MNMVEINVCPSTLQEGFTTYSPVARKQLFDEKEVIFLILTVPITIVVTMKLI